MLRAVSQVPRHLFVPPSVRHRAYEDSALPIGGGQTISQPWVQARYLEVLQLTGREKVLEIGTGSGYQTALLALVADTVFSVERIQSLASEARTALEAGGDPERDGAGRRRHPRLAALRAVRRDPGGRRRARRCPRR